MNGLCSVAECDKPVMARGWCSMHYWRWKHRGDPGSAEPEWKAHPCKAPGCERLARTHGFCKLHFRRWKRTGDPLRAAIIVNDDEARFWSKVDRDGPLHPMLGSCWAWKGSLFSGNGYAQFSVNRVPKGGHRVAYELLRGPIPVGLQLDHLCRNRSCVNPDHLEAVTGRTNTLRGETITAANLAKTHCPRGHPYEGANLGTTPFGGRYCRACRTLQAIDQNRKRRLQRLDRGLRRPGRPTPSMACSIEGCEKLVEARGWCLMHYARWRSHGDPGEAEPRRRVRAAARKPRPGVG